MKKSIFSNWAIRRAAVALLSGTLFISGLAFGIPQVRAEEVDINFLDIKQTEDDYNFYYYGSGGGIEEAETSANFDIDLNGSTGDELCVSSIAPLVTSEAGVEFIKRYEGCVLRAYDDLQSNVQLTEETPIKGTLTIGYGHTGSVDDQPITWDMEISQEKADELLRLDLAVFEKSVNAMAINHNIALTQNQFDALVSFTYNVGGAWTLDSRSSTIKNCLFNGIVNYSSEQIVYAFSLWNTSQGIVLPGLTRRRRAEAAFFLNDESAASYLPGQYVVSAASLDVRTGPGNSYSKVKTDSGYLSYIKDTIVDIIAIDKTYWGQCADGWIQLDYTRFTPGSATEPANPVALYPTGYYVVTAKSLNVRSRAAVESDKVKILMNGTALRVTEVSGKWGKMIDGWVSLDYCAALMVNPTCLTECKNTSEGIKLSWNKVEAVTGYIVYRFNGSEWNPIVNLAGADSLTYTDTSQKDGKTYRYSVSTYRSVDGDNICSDLCGELSLYRLSTPIVKAVSSKTKQQLVIIWKKNSKASGYEISYSTNKNMTKAKKVTISKKSTVKKTIKKLKSSKTYYIRIRAYKSISGQKTYSEWGKKYQIKVK